MIALGKRLYIFMLETEARAIGEVMNLEQEMPVALLYCPLVLVSSSLCTDTIFPAIFLRRGKEKNSSHPSSPANKLWSRFGNHVAYHISVVLFKGLFNNSTFEIGFERIKSQFSKNKDIDGTNCTKIDELKHFKFGAVTIKTTTEQLSKLKEIYMQRTVKIRTLEPLEYHISVQVSTLRLFYATTALIFQTEGILFQFTVGHAFTRLRDFMLSVHRFSKAS